MTFDGSTLDGPVLETARLRLRPPSSEDLEPWVAFMADERAALYIGGVQGRSDAWRGLCSVAGSWIIRGFAMFSVIEKASGRWVGRVGPWQPEAWPGTEVGWGIIREAWGRGYAPEAAAATIDWAFDTLGWDEVIHCIASENAASQAVARKLGSRVLRQARLPAPYDDPPVDIWGQSRAEWRARRSSAA